MPSDSDVAAWYRSQAPNITGTDLGAGYQATLTLIESPFGSLAVKRGRSRSLLGRASVSREYSVYQKLKGIVGIPRSYGLIEPGVLILEYIEGPSLREYETQLQDKEGFFAAMLQTIQAMHAAGVAHGDLKRKDNTIVGIGERPYLIDFGIASVLRPGQHLFNKIWFRWACQMDYNAWIKLKYGRNPTELSTADASLYKPLWIERFARAIRVPWQKITLRRLRKRWRTGA